MIYKGTFNTYDNKMIYYVQIGDIGDETTITDPTDPTVTNKEVMFGSNPVVINADRQDLQKRIIISQATISLVSNKNLTEYLFASNNRSIPVSIMKLDPEEVIFTGYVDPLQFDQAYAHNWEEVEVTATDPLGALEDSLIGQLSAWDADADIPGMTNLMYRPMISPYALLKLILDKAEINLGKNDTTTQAFYSDDYDYDNYIDVTVNSDVWTAFKTTIINTSIFFGDSQDDWESLSDTLDNVLKYFCMYIAMYGAKVMIMSTINHTPTERNKSIIQYGVQHNGTTTTKQIPLKDFASDESTSISVDEAYSQVNLTCEIEPVDSDVVKLSDNDYLRSDYDHQELYMTEIVSPGEGERAFNAFGQMIQLQAMRQHLNDLNWHLKNDNLSSSQEQQYEAQIAALTNARDRLAAEISYDNAYTVENYCYVLKNDAFNFGSDDDLDFKDRGGTNVFLGDEENYTKQNFTDQREALLWLTQKKFRSAFIGFGRGNKIQRSVTDNSPTPSIKLENWLVISTLGDFDNSENTAENALATAIKNAAPICKYAPHKTLILSPTDDRVTNYLIITGSILLNPIQQKTRRGQSWFAVNETTRKNFRSKGTWEGESTSDVSYDIRGQYSPLYLPTVEEMWHHTVPNPDNGDGAYYTQAWEMPQARWNLNSESRRLMGLYGYLDNNENQDLKYEYNEAGDSTDKISKLPIIACQLQVGNKYCVERLDLEDGAGKFQWMTEGEINDYNAQHPGDNPIAPYFTIGIDPKIGDNIIGQTFSIQNNIDYTMGLDVSGTAIPIKMDDRLSGDVKFLIMGPYNLIYNRITKSTHHKFIFWNCTHWNNETITLLNNISSIMIKDLKIEAKSDNGLKSQYATTADNDLVYYSDTNPKYVEKLEDDIKICTGLDEDEWERRGIKNEMSNSYVLVMSPNPNDDYDYFKGFGTNEVRPEECFVDYMYKEYSDAAKKLDTQMLTYVWRDDDARCLFDNGPLGNKLTYDMFNTAIKGMYPKKPTNQSWAQESPFMLMAYETNLKMAKMNLTIREDLYYYEDPQTHERTATNDQI